MEQELSVPAELQGLTREQLRFYRLIDEREMEPDGTQVLTLACGHTALQIVLIPETQEYLQCAQCVNAMVDLHALAREAYEAYRSYLVKADPDKNSCMFHWGQLPDRFNHREAWMAAVDGVRRRVASEAVGIARNTAGARARIVEALHTHYGLSHAQQQGDV